MTKYAKERLAAPQPSIRDRVEQLITAKRIQ
jgi:hypothetical protein